MSEIRISLDAEDFKTLIAGGIVRKDNDNVKILLKDIGYSMMYDMLYNEMSGKGFVMVQPSGKANNTEINSDRTHECVKCKNDWCKNMLIRRANTKYPLYCSGCYKSLDGKIIKTKEEVKSKKKKS